MRRPGFVYACLIVAAAGRLPAAPIPPSADPVAAFIAVADSVARGEGDAGLTLLIKDNPTLIGASVATLLDAGFIAGQSGNPTGEAENVAFAMQVADLYERNGGTATPRELVDTYKRWTPAQRTQRARAIALEEESNAARKAGDVPKAISLLDQARAIYEKIGDRHAVAVNWGTMGVARWSTGDFDAVLADYERALAVRRAVEDRILEGRTLNGIGSTYLQKGDNANAIEYYRQAIEVRRATGDAGGLGTSLTYLGNAYARAGRPVDARAQYQAALPILEAMGNATQMADLNIALGNLASDMGRVADANASYHAALDLATANGLGDKELIARLLLGTGYRLEGRFTDALAQFDAVHALLQTNPNPVETVAMHRERGLTYRDMGEFDLARDDLLACVEKAKALDNPMYAIEAQINIGYLYSEMGASARAHKAADEGRALAEAAGDARRYRDALVLRAEMERRAGQFDASLATWTEALAQDEADQMAALVLEDRAGIANVKAAMGKTAEARTEMLALLPQVRAAKLTRAESVCLFTIGDTYERENPDSAVAWYDRALAASEAVGAEVGGAEIRSGYLSAERRYAYEEVARYYLENHATTGDVRWSARAFDTIERAKARGLVELMQASVSSQSSRDESELLDRLYSLDPTAPDYATQRSALEARYLEYRRARMTTTMGGLARATRTVSIDEISQQLPKKTVMVAYALGDSASFAWVIDRDGHDVVRLPARAAIDADVRRLRDAIARPGAGDAALLASARSLYQTLLAPAATRLGRAETAIICPDGVLFELPFEALLTADPVAGAGWTQQPYFARRAATLYAPSATVYASLKGATRATEYTRDLLAVGNPDFSGLAPVNGAALAPLPFAQNEVEAIGAKVKDSRRVVLVGAAARESTVKHELRGGAPRVIHLATHGLVDAAEPTRSSVALAAGENEDGYFHTLEIVSTPAQSGLVVMSACESARGKVSRGEGVIGLNRAFLAAGAESVVASLWAVSDESTSELMKTFYERMLGKKRPASRALNEARLAMIENEKYAHPFYWSPFIVTGTERSPW